MRKSKPKQLVASVGRKWLISRGAPRKVRATVVEKEAFIHPTRGSRAEIAEASRLFDSEQAAIKSLKFVPGYIVDRREMSATPIKHRRDDSGHILLCDRKGNQISYYGQELFQTKRQVLEHLAKSAIEVHKANQRRLIESARAVERIKRKLARAS